MRLFIFIELVGVGAMLCNECWGLFCNIVHKLCNKAVQD